MKITFEVNKDDYINFNLYHLQNSKTHKKMFNILRYIIPIVFFILIYMIGTKIFNQPSIYWIIVAIIFSVLWILKYPKQYKRLIIKQTDKILNEGDNSSIFGRKTLEITDKFIEVKGEFTSEKVSLESIKEVKVYEDMILIYISGFMAHIIPRRYLDTETEKELIKQLNVF